MYFFVVDDEAKCWKCVYRDYKQNTIVNKLCILLGGSLNRIGHLGHNWRTGAHTLNHGFIQNELAIR